jgi:ketol-acid reductoisomerase
MNLSMILHLLPILLHEKKLFEMNRIISDTAEYGCYLFDHAAKPLLADFMKGIKTDLIGKGQNLKEFGVDNSELINVNEIIRYHPVEMIGYELRASMTAMKKII